MFSKHVTSSRPTDYSCDASAGAKSPEKMHTGGGEPASGVAFQGRCYRILLTTAAGLRPLVPGAAQAPLASPEGRRPARPAARWGMPGDTRGLSFRSFGRAARPEGEDKAVTQEWGGCESPRPPPPESLGCGHRLPRAASPPPAGLGLAGRPSPRPGRAAQPTCRPRGRRCCACPAAQYLVEERRELASGPSPPARPPRPGGRSLTFPARPIDGQLAVSSGPHPPSRVSGSSATLGTRRSAPRACAPPPPGPQAAPARSSSSPGPSPHPRACARGQGPWPRGGP